MTHWLDVVVKLLQADTSDLRELARLAGADPRTFYKGVELSKLDLAGQDLEGMEFSTPSESRAPVGTQFELNLPFASFEGQLLDKIRGARRQEERVVMLLAEFLRDRTAGMRILRSYLDRAKLTNSVINILIDVSDQELEGKVFTDLQIARRVSGRFTRSEDKRPMLAYFFAKHLGTHPELRSWLRKKSVYKLPKELQGEFARLLA